MRLPFRHLPDPMLADLADGVVDATTLDDRDRRHLATCDRCRGLRDGHVLAARLLAAPWQLVLAPVAAGRPHAHPVRGEVRSSLPATAVPSRTILALLLLAVALAALAISAVVGSGRPPIRPALVPPIDDASNPPSSPNPTSIAGVVSTLSPLDYAVDGRPSVRFGGPDGACQVLSVDEARSLLGHTPDVASGLSTDLSVLGIPQECEWSVTYPGLNHAAASLDVGYEFNGDLAAAERQYAARLSDATPESVRVIDGVGDDAFIARGYQRRTGSVFRGDCCGNTGDAGREAAAIHVRAGKIYLEILAFNVEFGSGWGSWSAGDPANRALPTDAELARAASLVLERLSGS